MSLSRPAFCFVQYWYIVTRVGSLSQPPKPLMAIRSSSGFSHLRPGYFTCIRIHKTQHTQPRGWKKREQTNKHGIGLAQCARRENFVTLFYHLVNYRECVFERNSHSHHERRLILSHWPIRPLGPHILEVGFSRLLLTALSLSRRLSCSVFLSAFFCSARGPSFLRLLPGFAPKQTKGPSDRHSPTPSPTQRMPNIVSYFYGFIRSVQFLMPSKYV